MNEEVIWNYLLNKLNNPYGVAALMGNLYVESRLDPGLLESSYAKKMGLTAAEYTKRVDNGTISKDSFINDKAGYGLAQWTYYTRKEALYNYAKQKGKSIADLDMQLDYLWDELQKYKTVIEALKNATNVREASDVVVKRYERPLNQTEKFLQNRANYGQGYFDKYAKSDIKYVVATANVNIRVGNDKSYEKVGLLQKGKKLPWVATADNGWYALKYEKQVCWVDSNFAKID